MNFNQQAIQRVLRTKQQASSSYDRLSRWYDMLAASETKFALAALRKLSLHPGERILEIGCGTGRLLPDISHSLRQDGCVIALDLSAGMLAVASKHLVQTPVIQNISLCRADAAWLPFGSSSFDAVFLSFTLELFDTPEIPQVLQQCRRVLCPNGRIAMAALERTEPPGIAVSIYEWFHTHMPVTVDCRPIYTRAALEAAGFDHIDIEQLRMWGLPVSIACARVG